jgi:Zn-dependent M28 family amino/carboxypeptidase
VNLIRELGWRPRRTLRVVLFANEEFGLSGANRYAQLETDQLPRHALAMEADLGHGPVWRLSSNVPPARLPLVREIQRVVKSLGVELGGNEAQGGADLGPLRRAGVAVLDPQLDATQYFDVHHNANDTLATVEPDKLRQSTAVFAVAAWLAATEAPAPPPAK